MSPSSRPTSLRHSSTALRAHMATPVSPTVLRNLALDILTFCRTGFPHRRATSATTGQRLVLRLLILVAFAITAEDDNNTTAATIRIPLPVLRQAGVSITYPNAPVRFVPPDLSGRADGLRGHVPHLGGGSGVLGGVEFAV